MIACKTVRLAIGSKMVLKPKVELDLGLVNRRYSLSKGGQKWVIKIADGRIKAIFDAYGLTYQAPER